MNRFEEYVYDTLADAVKARRDELAAAVNTAQAELDAKVKAFREITDEACAEADKKIKALAKKWGWKAEDNIQVVEMHSLESRLGEVFFQLRKSYDTRDGKTGYWYVDETNPVAIAQQALNEFDAAVTKAARRLVVVKKDLGMKAEAFDKMMAEAIEKLLK